MAHLVFIPSTRSIWSPGTNKIISLALSRIPGLLQCQLKNITLIFSWTWKNVSWDLRTAKARIRFLYTFLYCSLNKIAFSLWASLTKWNSHNPDFLLKSFSSNIRGSGTESFWWGKIACSWNCKMKKVFGVQCTLDLYGCQPGLRSNIE